MINGGIVELISQNGADRNPGRIDKVNNFL